MVFYDNPLLTLDRVLKNGLASAPNGRDVFAAAMRSLLGRKARVASALEAALGESPLLLVSRHHLSHAASAFYPSPFENAAILTIDGVGEWSTCTIGVGKVSNIELPREIRYPHSLGLLYSAFTYLCGFKVNSGEYKLMGLAPYGEPRYADIIRDRLIDIRSDGSFRLDMDYFGYIDSPLMINDRFATLFGGPAREPESRITRREMDLAASVQLVTEEIVLKLAAEARRLTGLRHLVMAGGVALNCVANGRVLREAGFDGLWVQPAAGDAGGALGAALLVSYREGGAQRVVGKGDTQFGSLLGPQFSATEVAAIIDRQSWPNDHIPNPDARAARVAGALAEGKIVGLFAGRMEFGPRSLGARSILGDSRRAEMQVAMNLKVKFRESFRPFAPAVLRERAAAWFDLDGESPYMLTVAPVREDRRVPAAMGVAENDDMLAIVAQTRSEIPAVTHVDNSARVQTVGNEANPDFRRILEQFDDATGCPVLVNTSFNVRGEPIVCTPQDAYRCFMRTGIDLLVLEDRLLWKTAQPEWVEAGDWRTVHVND